MSQGLTEVVRLVSHDLANLFTCILAASSGEADANDVAAIREAARTGSELLQVLRDLGQRRPGACRVADVIAPCSALLRHIARARGVELATSIEAGEVAIPGYELQEIVLNLGLNAIAALPDGGHVAIAAALDGAHVIVSVRDDGPGMPPEPRPDGLGLVATREIVERAGGEVTIASGSTGTEIRIALPRGA